MVFGTQCVGSFGGAIVVLPPEPSLSQRVSLSHGGPLLFPGTGAEIDLWLVLTNTERKLMVGSRKASLPSRGMHQNRWSSSSSACFHVWM